MRGGVVDATATKTNLNEHVDVYAAVLSDPCTCKLFILELLKRGCKISVPLETLNHEQMIEVGLSLITEINRKGGGDTLH
jgi:hypothetical protein